MKRLLTLLALTLSPAIAIFAQTPLNPSHYTVATLPAASTLTNKVVNVTDGLTKGDCTVGGGVVKNSCISDGTSWLNWGGDGTGTGGTLTDVNGTTPINSSHGTTPTVSIDNAKADGATKGAADFLAADFNDDAAGKISLDYVNGQAADATHKGFLPSADWVTFNAKEAPGIDLRIANNLSDLANPGTARTNLGGSTVGQNLFTAINPSTISFPKVAADNSVSFRTPSQVLSDIGAQGSGNYLVDCGSNGWLARSALNTTVCRTFIGTSNRLTITNTTGGGDPVLNVPDAAQLNIAKLLNLTTNGPLYVSGGDGTLNSETVVNSVRGGTGVNNAGTLTNASNTTITGGGTLALGGFTFTIPATGTAVETSRTITEGNGLAGNTYDLSANRTLALGTPSTLTVSTSNSASGTTHSHAITSSSNPGAAASILATDASGYLTTVRHTVTDYFFVNNATANLFLKNTSTGWKSSTTLVLNPQSGNSVCSNNFTSGLSGWCINDAGDAEFNNVTTRGELRASTFKYSEISATAGTFGVFTSASTTKSIFATPTIGTLFSIDVKNADSGGNLFGNGEVLRLKAFVNDGTYVVADSWVTPESFVNHGAYTTYTVRMRSGSEGATFQPGTAIVDYGLSGAGFITLSADGTIGSSPNLTMGTHAGAPWSAQTLLLRLGNLNGSYGYAVDTNGFGVGSYAVSGQPWLTVETTNGIRIGNNTTVLGQWDTSGNIIVGQVASGQSNVRISSGAVDLRNNTTIRTHLASDGSGYFANSSFSFDASGNVSIAGNTTIAGWTINSTAIQNSGGTVTLRGAGNLAFGSTPPTSASAGTGLFIDSTGMYGLLSSVVQAKFDAVTGAITAGAGNVVLDSNGITLSSLSSAGRQEKITWGSSGDVSVLGQSDGTNTTIRLNSITPGTGGTGYAELYSQNSSGSRSTAFSLQGTSAGGQLLLYNTGGTFLGFTVGANATPNAMLDVRGDIFSTGSLGATGSRLVKGWFTDLQVTNAITGSVTGNAATATALATARTIGGVSFDGSANITVASATGGFTISGGTGLNLASGAVINFNSGNFTITHSSAQLTLAGGRFDVGGTYRASGQSGAFGSGAGIEFSYASNVGYIQSYNRDTSTNKTLYISGNPIQLNNGNEGGVTVGSAADKGGGSISAVTVWRNGTSLDSVFDHDYKLMSIDAMGEFVKANHHLPTIPTNEVNQNGSTNLGALEDRLWETTENHALYFIQLNDEIKTLKAKVADLEKRRN